MPQENQVLRCFSCETFQVHIVKKSKKWECKICGAKQSFKRHYGRGTGKDCRNHVMKLNELRFANSSLENVTEDDIHEEISAESEPVEAEKKSVSKWDKYLDEDEDEDEDTHCEPKKKRRKNERCDARKESDDKGTDYQSTKLMSSKYSKYLEVEGNELEKKNSKNIFESSLENVDDLLSFI